MEGGIKVSEMSNREIREALIAITRVVPMQANLNMMPRVVEITMTSRLNDFVRMNPPIFLGSKVNKDPQEFLDGVIWGYAPSIVSNQRDEMSRFVTGVDDLVVEECRTAMLHDDMTLDRLMVYAQQIEESKLSRMDRSLERSGDSDQEQTRFKKKVQSQGKSRSAKFKVEKGGGSKDGKPTCAKWGKKH
ncbi:uncharacterized protein [Solanum lycopersicum]|uniref:uncharacterized protein n=1 Tax=Solanum lycopersicum TaxID=4081 RepID=UPI003749B592